MDLPARIGPCEFAELGALKMAMRYPRDYDADAERWRSLEADSRRWLLERRRINPVIRTLRRTVDPLFHHFGLILDA
jgi:hypothetical protein